MDWIKIKTKHYFYLDLTLAEIGLLIKIQCLAAQLEKIPTEKQILKIPGSGSKRLQHINKVLTSDQQSINNILTKVLQDVNKVSTKREQSKEKMANWREKKAVVTGNVTSREERREETIRVENINTEKTKKFIPPTVNQIADYCLERNNNIDPEQFFNHYEARDWISGKTKIKKWKACIITWEKNNKSSPVKTFKQIDQDREKDVIRNFLKED